MTHRVKSVTIKLSNIYLASQCVLHITTGQHNGCRTTNPKPTRQKTNSPKKTQCAQKPTHQRCGFFSNLEIKRKISRSQIISNVKGGTGNLGISLYIKTNMRSHPTSFLKGCMYLVDWFLHPYLNLRSWLDLRFKNACFFVFSHINLVGAHNVPCS